MKTALITSLAAMLIAAAASAQSYPQPLRRAFIESCVGVSKELVQPCRCILEGLERSILADDLEALIKANRADKDPRVQSITQNCARQK